VSQRAQVDATRAEEEGWDHTEKELTVVFEEHRDHGQSRCIPLRGDDGTYLSAIGEGFGPYIPEWLSRETAGIRLLKDTRSARGGRKTDRPE
jgi:hypothetical protein